MAGLASTTYDPSESASFTMEHATSGRSKCRNPSCLGAAKTITKGDLRIGRMEKSPTAKLDAQMRGKLVPKWVHIACCAKVILREAIDNYGSIDGVPGFDSLDADGQAEARRVTAAILGDAAATKKKKKKTVTKKKAAPKKKAATKRSRDSISDVEPAKKKAAPKKKNTKKKATKKKVAPKKKN